MGAELGATTSIFPSDEITRQFLTAQTEKMILLSFRLMQMQNMKE
jgi:aconitase A